MLTNSPIQMYKFSNPDVENLGAHSGYAGAAQNRSGRRRGKSNPRSAAGSASDEAAADGFQCSCGSADERREPFTGLLSQWARRASGQRLLEGHACILRSEGRVQAAPLRRKSETD